MPISKNLSRSIIDSIFQNKSPQELAAQLSLRQPLDEPLPEGFSSGADMSREAQAKRLAVFERKGLALDYLAGKQQINDPAIFEGNIENYLGLAQIPIGVIGPLRVNGLYAHGDFYVPLATTEGALVASYQRGAKVISHSGGARVICTLERISRAPGFAFHTLLDAATFVVWAVEQFEVFRDVAQATTSHGKLEDFKITVDGNNVHINFEYTTGDAAGQNMVTFASEAVCQHIMANSPIKPRFYFIESNLSGDKKATAISYLFGRGKNVIAEALIPRKIFTRFLHTTPEMMMEYWKMSFTGGVQSGSIGVQGHYANGLAAMFIACGQDAACVAEVSTGITRVDVTEAGDLYMAVTLPNLVVGTVGGGTRLPTQRECLELMGCRGKGSAKKFAEICAAVVLGGEISIMGALAAGQFAKAHKDFGRKGKNNNARDE